MGSKGRLRLRRGSQVYDATPTFEKKECHCRRTTRTLHDNSRRPNARGFGDRIGAFEAKWTRLISGRSLGISEAFARARMIETRATAEEPDRLDADMRLRCLLSKAGSKNQAGRDACCLKYKVAPRGRLSFSPHVRSFKFPPCGV